MKRLMMACLLAVSSHGWTANLDPECYALYDMFTRLDNRATIARSNIAGEMYDLQCWPALQGDSDMELQPATDCGSLVPYVVKMVNDLAHVNGYSILNVVDAKAMTYETIDRVADGHDIFQTIADNMGRSMRFRQSLKYDDKTYARGKGHYTGQSTMVGYDDNGYMITDTPTYGDQGAVLVPNSEPFAASPLTGSTRALDCSTEARFTQGSYLLQMYMDRASDGQEFIGMAVLMELR